MSIGYIDPTTKQYVKAAGNMNIWNTPTATETSNGLLSYEDKKKIDKAYTTDNIASDSSIEALFETE